VSRPAPRNLQSSGRDEECASLVQSFAPPSRAAASRMSVDPTDPDPQSRRITTKPMTRRDREPHVRKSAEKLENHLAIPEVAAGQLADDERMADHSSSRSKEASSASLDSSGRPRLTCRRESSHAPCPAARNRFEPRLTPAERRQPRRTRPRMSASRPASRAPSFHRFR